MLPLPCLNQLDADSRKLCVHSGPQFRSYGARICGRIFPSKNKRSQSIAMNTSAQMSMYTHLRFISGRNSLCLGCPTEANPIGAQPFDDVAAKSPLRRRSVVAATSLRRWSAPLRSAKYSMRITYTHSMHMCQCNKHTPRAKMAVLRQVAKLVPTSPCVCVSRCI